MAGRIVEIKQNEEGLSRAWHYQMFSQMNFFLKSFPFFKIKREKRGKYRTVE